MRTLPLANQKNILAVYERPLTAVETYLDYEAMSSINHHPTFHYSQPDAYRFSHDSVFLARRVFEIERDKIRPEWHGLDLCAGCGIVGLDFLFHCKNELGLLPRNFDFLELQTEYAEHFQLNQARLNAPATTMRFLEQNYNQPLPAQYDLIVCNPPYFDPGAGQLSPNGFKNRCRFFLDGTQAELLVAIGSALRPGGRAYVLTRSENPPLEASLEATLVGDIRGTPLICYERKLPHH